jgi:hypothetical protein
MIQDRMAITGRIKATVRTADGEIKRWNAQVHLQHIRDKFKTKEWLQILWSLFFLPIDAILYRQMISQWHNIVTDYGDALIADLMSMTPVKQKLDNTHGYVEVGTAYSATAAKQQNAGTHTPTGARKVMSSTYPKQKGAFAAANDNVVQYRANFGAGDLNATINEAALLNASTSGECLAYGHITPDAVVSTSDTLEVDWELTILGA